MKRRLLALLACVFIAMLAFPSVALAKKRSATNEETHIEAIVQSDGTLEVLEQRTVKYKGSYHGFYWDVLHEVSELGDGKVDVEAAGEVISGRLRPYTLSEDVDGTEPGTFDICETSTSGGMATRIDLHFSKANQRATFYVKYRLTGVVARWADTGEVYWKFVGDSWDSTSYKVTCDLYLPAQEGAQITAGDTVRAWLHHAALTGTVHIGEGKVPAREKQLAVDAGAVQYKIPSVSRGHFAEARIVFPADWLSEARARSQKRLDHVLEEEARWANEANARRESDEFWCMVKVWIARGFTGLLVVLGVVSFVMYKREHKAKFSEKYFRDVPTDDHPAVLVALLEEPGSSKALTATLMRLTDLGYVSLEKITVHSKNVFGKEKAKDDYVLTLNRARASEVTDAIDAAVLDFLFGYVADRAVVLCQRNDDFVRSEDVLLLSDIQSVASHDEEVYLKHLKEWTQEVEKEFARRGYGKDDDGKSNGRVLLVLSTLCAFLGAFLLFDWLTFSDDAYRRSEYNLQIAIWSFALIVLSIWGIVFAVSFKNRSGEAVEVTAKLKALRRWLLDFTKLDEAVPGDVVLWNRLLVMAVGMGISAKVIEQLKVAVPHLMRESGF
ncbi:MAG: DUF2207 domain-containing protein [Atopobiaceae bacterium]|nr:DUF2207 domain-containing protein [Atopobiaceae bacterium]